MAKSADENIPQSTQSVMADPIKLVPKLVTKIGVAKSNSGNTILTLILELPEEPPVLIERIVLDNTTVDSLIKVLEESKEAEVTNE